MPSDVERRQAREHVDAALAIAHLVQRLEQPPRESGRPGVERDRRRAGRACGRGRRPARAPAARARGRRRRCAAPPRRAAVAAACTSSALTSGSACGPHCEQVAGDDVGVGAAGHQRARGLAVQALALGPREVLADRGGDQAVGEALAAGGRAGRRPAARRAPGRARRPATPATAATTCGGAPSPMTASAAATARSRGGQRRPAAGARRCGRSRVTGGASSPACVERRRAVRGDLAAELAQQPRVAADGAMAVAAHDRRGVRRQRGGSAAPRRGASAAAGAATVAAAHAAEQAQQVRRGIADRRRARRRRSAAAGRRSAARGRRAPPARSGRPTGRRRHERERSPLGDRRAQPEHAVGDQHRRVAAGHGARRAAARRPPPRLRRAAARARCAGRVAQRRLQQRAHDAEGEVALERARARRGARGSRRRPRAARRARAAPSCPGPRGPRARRRRRRRRPAGGPRSQGTRARPRARSAASLRRSWPRRAIRWRADGGHYCGGGRRWPTRGA